ncbi:MAG TPA: right-handed parallel beta-helix repeat-containing protein [Thermotogota bacterium]|nr:right-handed parallel beta-helix repeat-containing protein [Thermotogota bacterium]HPJ88119.1 right-handed parallel beta-helix repeat-containing protein [Thermotogota bacterium]
MKKQKRALLGIVFLILFLFVSCDVNFVMDLFTPETFSEKLSEPADYTVNNPVYVSVTGSDDTGNGSQDRPYRTINHALSQCSGGETVMLAAGTYQEEVRIDLPNITLRPADINNDHVVIRNVIDDEDQTFAIWIYVDGSGCRLQNLEIAGGYYYAIKIETTWDWGEPERYGASDIIIEDCIIHDSGRDCIKITPNCNNITIRRCEIYNSGVGPSNIAAENAEGIDNVNGDNLIVQDCFIHDIYTTGIYFKGGAQDCIIERNIIRDTGFSGILIGFDTSTDYFDLEVNPDYYESINGIVRNNVIVNTVYAGIGLYASKDAHVYNNTIIDTAKAAMSPIYFGLSFQDWDPVAKRPANINPEIYNNIVSQNNIDSAMIYIRYADELGGMSSLEGPVKMDNNCYYTNGTLYFEDRRPDSEFYTESFTAWKNHLYCDTNSSLDDPLLIQEYRLSSDSPCIDRGKNLNWVTYDVDDKKRTEPYDIGASEF